IEQLRDTFTVGATARFQTTVAQVGAKQDRASIKLPESDQAFAQIWVPTLLNYQSTPELPQKVKFMVIGSGLSGSQAALEFAEGGFGAQTAVLEAENAPARAASGKNGYNFETICENFFGAYEGLVKERFDFLKDYHKTEGVPDSALRRHAERQASFHIEWGMRNGALLKANVEKYGIDADF